MRPLMKISWMLPLGLALCVAPFAVRSAMAASRASAEALDLDAPTATTTRANDASQDARVARATATFDNARFDRAETSWGRFVADALRSRTDADIALVNASALERGVLRAGDVRESDIAALLSFGDDEIATITLSGTQLRAALERAVGAFPTGSPAWLHLSGMTATFNPKAKSGARLQSLQVNGRDVASGDSFKVAMPIGLAEGGAGYYKIWKGGANGAGVSLLKTIVDYARTRRDISPDDTARLRSS